jgi:Putative MetA-pathway of phenol degradation
VSNRARQWMNRRQSKLIVATMLLYRVGCTAQELEPRAYSISPTGTNFGVISFIRSAGDVSFAPALPVEEGSSILHATIFSYGRTLDFFGRSASVSAAVPYLWGELQGKLSGTPVQAQRSGLANLAMRFSVNLYGAPAMDLAEFAHYQQKTNLGASVALVAPLGQYDPARLVNIGTNRWAVKPEIGVSQHLGRWYLDLYLGAWLFSANDDYQGRVRKQDPIGSVEVHVSYNVAPRLWASFDGNFYTGGRTSIDGIDSADLQRNSRVGGTIAIPVAKRQSIKFQGSTGAITNLGANFVSLGVAYQYLWGSGL